MTDFERSVINLIKSGLTGEKCKVDSNIDLDALYSFALNHHVALLVYYGLLKSEIPISDELKQKFKSLSYKYIYISNNQLYEIMRIAQEFEKADIVYQLLKGAVLKQLYPHPEMRYMSDADILIKTSQYEKITEVMKNLGFEFKYESDHELVWSKKNCLTVELHKRLIPSYNPDMYLYYGEGWKVFDKNSSKSNFADENQYVYIFTHLAKHYRDGGAGIKYIIDLYVYLKAKPNMDFEYIKNELEKLNLAVFYENVMKMIDVWFCEDETTKNTDFLTRKVFESGAYGNFENHTLSKGYKETKKRQTNKNIHFITALNTFFPSFEDMARLYPVLKSAAVLLPFLWVYRWFDVLFTRKKNIKKAMRKIEISNQKNVEEYKNELNQVGLDFEGLEDDFPFESCALLSLISNGLFNTSETIPNEANIDEVFKESSLQSVSVIAFDGMLKSGISGDYIEKYKRISQTVLIRNVQIQNAHGVLHKLLTDNGIPYCILKGCASAYYYPNPDFRSMGDIDFYISPSLVEKTSKLLIDNGFKMLGNECEHHSIFVKNGIHYELHYDFPGVPLGECKEKTEEYLSDTVETASIHSNNCCIFNNPDPFHHGLIMLLHTSHHLLAEGIGLRHLCDWAVFVNSFTSEEFEKLFKEKLEAIGLWKFARILSGVAVDYIGLPYKEWIGKIDSKISKELIIDILAGGNFGRKIKTRFQEVYMISYFGKNSSEESVIKQLFITLNNLSYLHFPYIKKFKFFLPIGWIYFSFKHLFKVLTGKRKWLFSKNTVDAAKKRKDLYANFHLFEVKR